MKSVVIAGAGISGLSLAWALRGYGIGVRVFEADSRPGGKLKSDRIAGFLVETGPQSFGFRDPAAASLVADLGLDDRLLRATGAARSRAVVADGTLHHVPLSPLSFARTPLLPVAAKVRLLCDLALPRGPTSLGDDESVAEFARRRFGARGAQRVFFPMVSGLYTGDPELLSLSAAFPRLAALEKQHRSVLLGALAGLRASAFATQLATFREGMGTLTAELGVRLGRDLALKASITSIRSSGSGWDVHVLRGVHREVVHADAVALTAPAHALGPVLETEDPALAASISRIPYAPIAVAYLGYRQSDLPRLPKAYGFYTPSTEPNGLLGAVFTSALFPLHAPAGHHLIACRMGGSRQSEILGLRDDEIASGAHRELSRLLEIRREPVFSRVVRHPRALPQYTLGHLERLQAIDAALSHHSGLFLTGNAYRGLGILDCLREAPLLARRMAEHLSWPFSANP
ncbi:MAG TPA: protoporphyrinogen oxidase [Myxococcales bacterium]|jgi:oxygen-dependent protoporphyrinogen oxidase